MRQRSQTSHDAKLRGALERMRYCACTDADIELLRTRVVGEGLGRPKLRDSRFHHVSVITSYNAYRDKINEIRTQQFASESGQSLCTFYSKDKWRPDVQEGHKSKRRFKRDIDPHRRNNYDF